MAEHSESEQSKKSQRDNRAVVASAASERIEEQHAHLRDMIAEIRGTLENQEEEVEQVNHQLAALLKELVAHFLDEEDDGFFDQIEQKVPRLSPEVRHLKEEHQQFLEQMRVLVATAESRAGTPLWWQSLKTDFHEFSKALMHHESTENQLLQRAYNEDIGTRD